MSDDAAVAACESVTSLADSVVATSESPFKAFVAQRQVFLAVMIFVSVGFLEGSALPTFLQTEYVRSHHNATKDEIEVAVSTQSAAFSFLKGIPAVAVAGWAGRLSDRFGRRTMAFVSAMGQALGMLLVAIAAYYECSWQIIACAWAVQGLFGGAFVFLAAAFAYLADWRQQAEATKRARAFAALDSTLLMVAGLGPLAGGPLVAQIRFSGAFAVCAGMYAIAATVFFFAPPSPQRTVRPASGCSEWCLSSTVALLWRMLFRRRLNVLCVGFLLGMLGVSSGAGCLVFYGQRFLGWDQMHIAALLAIFSSTGSIFCFVVQPLACKLFRRRVSDLTIVRVAYIGPILYFTLVAMLPLSNNVLYGLLPLLSFAACAIPHWRALFSLAQTDDAQGEQMSLIAALESVPQLISSPIVAVTFRFFIHTPWIVLIGAGAVLPAMTMLLVWLGVREKDEDQQPTSSFSGGRETHTAALLEGAVNANARAVGVADRT